MNSTSMRVDRGHMGSLLIDSREPQLLLPMATAPVVKPKVSDVHPPGIAPHHPPMSVN